jgi:SAM-dependent methyltransferase
MSPLGTTRRYAPINRRGWDHLVSAGCDSTRICTRDDLAAAAQLLDPHGWLPWEDLGTVLCLAAGGGQQGPMFASLGYDVTVADLSPAQLAQDRQAAERYGLAIETVVCDAMDPAPLAGRRFDLVYQPVSTLYLPDVGWLYRNVADLLTPGGWYWSEHWNPVEMQLDPVEAWDGTAYRLSQPHSRGAVAAPAGARLEDAVCWHYIHPLHDLLGGMGRAGLAIRGFAERAGADLDAAPGSRAHLGAYIPGFFAVLAQKPERGGARR